LFKAKIIRHADFACITGLSWAGILSAVTRLYNELGAFYPEIERVTREDPRDEEKGMVLILERWGALICVNEE